MTDFQDSVNDMAELWYSSQTNAKLHAVVDAALGTNEEQHAFLSNTAKLRDCIDAMRSVKKELAYKFDGAKATFNVGGVDHTFTVVSTYSTSSGLTTKPTYAKSDGSRVMLTFLCDDIVYLDSPSYTKSSDGLSLSMGYYNGSGFISRLNGSSFFNKLPADLRAIIETTKGNENKNTLTRTSTSNNWGNPATGSGSRPAYQEKCWFVKYNAGIRKYNGVATPYWEDSWPSPYVTQGLMRFSYYDTSGTYQTYGWSYLTANDHPEFPSYGVVPIFSI